MYALLSYPGGIILEAVLVSRTRNRMRVVASGLPEAFEVKRTSTGWLTDAGDQVEFEFVAAISPAPQKAVVGTALAAGSFAI